MTPAELRRRRAETARRRDVRRRALEASGWTVIDARGAGVVTHPAFPYAIFTVAEAVARIREGHLPSCSEVNKSGGVTGAKVHQLEPRLKLHLDWSEVRKP